MIRSLWNSLNAWPAPHRRRGRRGEAGFTLIESMMLMTVVTVGMSSLLLLMTSGSRMNSGTRDSMASYQAANELIEWFRQIPFDSPYMNNCANTPFGQNVNAIGNEALKKLQNPQGTYTIETPNANLKKITVKVSWSERSSTRNRTISLVTLIAKKGLNEKWR